MTSSGRAAMTYVRGCEHDVFVSYAHLDNGAGWIDSLEALVQRRVGEILGEPIDVWRDPQLDGTDRFEARIRSALPLDGNARQRRLPQVREVRELPEGDPLVSGKATSARRSRRVKDQLRVRKTPFRYGETEPRGTVRFRDAGLSVLRATNEPDRERIVEFESSRPSRPPRRFYDQAMRLFGGDRPRLHKIFANSSQAPGLATIDRVFLAETASRLSSSRSQLRARSNRGAPRGPGPVALGGSRALLGGAALLNQASVAVHMLRRVLRRHSGGRDARRVERDPVRRGGAPGRSRGRQGPARQAGSRTTARRADRPASRDVEASPAVASRLCETSSLRVHGAALRHPGQGIRRKRREKDPASPILPRFSRRRSGERGPPRDPQAPRERGVTGPKSRSSRAPAGAAPEPRRERIVGNDADASSTTARAAKMCGWTRSASSS